MLPAPDTRAYTGGLSKPRHGVAVSPDARTAVVTTDQPPHPDPAPDRLAMLDTAVDQRDSGAREAASGGCIAAVSRSFRGT